jgi:hypothetical protein
MGTVYAAVNGPCSANGTPGVCVSTTSCSESGGKSHTGFCPEDPVNIKCCTKTSCGNGGSCKQVDDCDGITQTGLCPGPANFKCCLPPSSRMHPRPGPDMPGPHRPPPRPSDPPFKTARCKPHVVAHARTIVRKFPGRVYRIGCYREKRKSDRKSDHHDGLAVDLMVKVRYIYERTARTLSFFQTTFAFTSDFLSEVIPMLMTNTIGFSCGTRLDDRLRSGS